MIFINGGADVVSSFVIREKKNIGIFGSSNNTGYFLSGEATALKFIAHESLEQWVVSHDSTHRRAMRLKHEQVLVEQSLENSAKMEPTLSIPSSGAIKSVET